MQVMYVADRVHAGFPSPAQDLGAQRLDVAQLLVTHPHATFMLRVRGHSMRDAGIFDNDMLVVDRSVQPRHQHIVVAVVDGAFTVKRWYQRGGVVKLQAAHPDFADIVPQAEQTLEVWGVVTHCIKSFLT
jgi:DNA polymerase V